MGAHVGLALPVLAAFLERPFISWSGVSNRALPLSIQANFLSALVIGITGFFILGAAWGSGDALMFFWMFAAVGIAVMIEYMWLARPWSRRRRKIAWGYLLIGNLFSAGLIFALPVLREIFGSNSYSHLRWIQPLRGMIALITLAVCAMVYLMAFLRSAAVSDAEVGRGFEVLPAAAIPTPPADPQTQQSSRV